MDQTEFRTKVAAIEAQSFKYDFQIADAFRDIAPHDQLTKEQFFQTESEFILFRFMTKSDLDDTAPRFRPMVEYTNGDSFPNAGLLTEERLDYYLERSKIVKNPIMLARYLDISLEYNPKIDKDEIAKAVVAAYIDASKNEDAENGMDIIDCITRAFLVAKDYKDKNPESLTSAITNVLESLKRFESNNIRWTNELIELIIKFHESFTSQQLKTALEVATHGVQHYSTDNTNFTLHESFLDLEHTLSQMVKPDDYDAATAARESAQIYIDEAERRVDGGFVRQLHLLKAEKILRAGGLNQEANAIHSQVEAIGKEPEYLNSMQEFSFTQRIPQEEIDKLSNAVTSSSDPAAYLALSNNFTPSWKAAKAAAKKDTETHISDMIGNLTVNEDGVPIARDDGSPELRKIIRYYDSQFMVSSVLQSIVIPKLVADGKFTYDHIKPHIDKLQMLNKDTYDTVKLGFEYWFAGKCFEAVSILVPQLEDILGDLVQKFGISRYRQKDDDLVEYKTLGPILSDLKKTLGDDTYHFLHYALIDPAKHNLRNYNGHGKIKSGDKDIERKALLVLVAYLAVLAPLQIEVKVTEVKSKKKRKT